VSTPQGPVPIGRLVEQKALNTKIYDMDGLTEILAVKENGVKPVIRIILKNGNTLDLTQDHLVFTDNSSPWVEAGKLVPGMRLLQITNTDISENDGNVDSSNKKTLSEAVLAGWLTGDGFAGQYENSSSSSLILEFMTADEEEYEFLLPHIRSVFEDVHYHVINVETLNENLSLRRIRLYGEKLRPFIEKYDSLKRGLDMRIPAAILNGGKKAASAYLRSLFQSDGTVRSHTGPTDSYDVVLGSISKDLICDTQKLLANAGIYSRISVCEDKRDNRHTYSQL
jgi:ribonucleoside-diphosphate reductase alpha chain